MPNFLTIDGTNYEVLTSGATEDEPEVGGMLLEWSWDATAQLTVSPERRRRPFDLGPVSMAAYEALRTLALTGPRSVGGPAMGDGTKQRVILVTGADYLADGIGFLMLPHIVIIDSGTA